jgi:hypothetical protein
MCDGALCPLPSVGGLVRCRHRMAGAQESLLYFGSASTAAGHMWGEKRSALWMQCVGMTRAATARATAATTVAGATPARGRPVAR